MFKIIFLISILQSISLFAQSSLDLTTVDQLINGGLKTIIQSQKTENNIPLYWKGEWPSVKMNLKSIPYLGKKGKHADDSNCFTTTHVHNELASFALRNKTQIARLTPTLNLAFENILTFKGKENTFNFWHALPLTEKQKGFTDEKHRNIIIHRPNQFELTNNFTLMRSNVPDDADDTAMAYSASHLRSMLGLPPSEISEKTNWHITADDVPAEFEKYRDINRKGGHPLNRLHGNFINTGGFLTWLSDQNRSFLGSLSINWDDNVRIPFGVNDLDCVVNSNVLQAMALHGHAQRESVQQACRYIEKAIDKGLSKKCGFYYPNPYHLHYAVSKALDAGATCLESAAKKLNSELISEQNPNGSWGWVNKPKSIRKLNLQEPVSSTIYATNALIIFSEKLNLELVQKQNIDSAVHFITKNAITKEDQSVSWKAGVFFSGGGFVRRVLVWTSEAYTTMLAITALDKYRHNPIYSGTK